MSLIAELKRRNVFRVMVLYIITGWVLLQAADLFSDILPVPQWTVSLVFVLLLLGFPVAAIFSWVYEITPEGLKLEKDVDRSDSITHQTGHRLELLIGVVAVLAIVTVVVDRLIPETGTESERIETASSDLDVYAEPAEMPVDHSIAVLPFVDMSEAGDQQYFSDGLAEELLNLLAKLPELRVASRTSSFSFRDSTLDLPAIANRLRVRHVLEGSVRKQGDTIRVTAQLIDAETNFHEWSETYQRRQSDIFAIQDDIARQVVAVLQPMLSTESRDVLAQQSTVDIDAFDKYLQGRDYLRQPVSEASLSAAEQNFQTALELDARYVDAHAGLCETRLERYQHSFEIADFEAAERACNRALTLNPGESSVLVALGHLYRLSGQTERAEQSFARAIDIDDRNASAFAGLASTFEAQDRPTEARSAYQRAIDLQPGFWNGYMAMGGFLFRTGRSREGLEYMRQAVDLSPVNPRALNSLGTTLYMVGEFGEARRVWLESLRIDPTPIAYSNLGTANFLLKDFERAAAMYTRAVELTPDDPEIWGALGDAYRFIPGKEDQSASSFNRAIELAEDQLELNPTDGYSLAMMAHWHASTDRLDEASSALSRAFELSPDNMYVHYFAALVAATAGDIDGAIDYSRTAIEQGYPGRFLVADAGLGAIAGELAFRQLVERDEGDSASNSRTE